MGEEEKNYIIRQADMYISGKSLREIAEIIGKSHITVRNNLTKKLQELLNKRAAEGWRLVKYDFSDWLGACVVVFEK